MSSGRASTMSHNINTLHSEQIRSEIQRFESVHPCIYQIYDLLDFVPDPHIQAQIRDQVVCIEDAFVNSHEWTLSRSVSELRLGVVGSQQSGKTSLVHRYLTGQFTAEESPEGGRFKKEVVVEGQSHLLLIRDEGNGIPDAQFTHWADAVIFVFSVDNTDSLDKVRHYCNQMSKYRNISDMPLILVGTKDTITEKNPRMISEEEGRQLALHHLRKAGYYETCATYGLNVERVFKDACSRIISHRARLAGHRTPTPTTPLRDSSTKDYQDPRYMSAPYGTVLQAKNAPISYHQQQRSSSAVPLVDPRKHQQMENYMMAPPQQQLSGRGESGRGVDSHRSSSAFPTQPARQQQPMYNRTSSPSAYPHPGLNGLQTRSSAALLDERVVECGVGGPGMVGLGESAAAAASSASTSHLPTPSSTPTTQRKNRRISNIFQRPGKEKDNQGGGREIPLKQGQLYKKSSKAPLQKEWKKKYVCLYADGRITYYTSLKDYMDGKGGSGKTVDLALATVRVAGRQHVRGSTVEEKKGEKEERVGGGEGLLGGSGEGTSGGGSDDASTPGKDKERQSAGGIPATPQTVASGKKRRPHAHRRLGSGQRRDEAGEADDECFEIVTSDQKRWEFCASSTEDRDEWVAAIEQQISCALENLMSAPCTGRVRGVARSDVRALRQMAGNGRCADCGQPEPEWASLNLGILICIQCSGLHRNLGTHISKVRSLTLDDFPAEALSVMTQLGNDAANNVWEKMASVEEKPTPDARSELKEAWIRAKYVDKRWLAGVTGDVKAKVIEATLCSDLPLLQLLLAVLPQSELLATTVSRDDTRTPLHLAAASANIATMQFLIWHGVDIKALDNNGRSALWFAQTSGSKAAVELLVAAGLPADHGLPSAGGAATQSHSHQQDVFGSVASRRSHVDRGIYEFNTLPDSTI